MNTCTYHLLLLLFCCSLLHSSLAQNNNAAKDKAQLRKMEYDWLAAEFKRDTATISRMMDERFMSIGLHAVTNKQQELQGMYENISERLKNGHVVDSFYLDAMQVQLFDNTAVVSFLSVTRGNIKGIPFENRKTRMYDVWIKRNNRWWAISSQVTPLR